MKTTLVKEKSISRTASREAFPFPLIESDFTGVRKSQALRNAIRFLFDKLYVTGDPISHSRIQDQIKYANEDASAGNNYVALQEYFTAVSNTIKLSVIDPDSIRLFAVYGIKTASDFASVLLKSAEVPAKKMCNPEFNNALRQLQKNSDDVVKVLTNIYERQGWGAQSLDRIIGL